MNQNPIIETKLSDLNAQTGVQGGRHPLEALWDTDWHRILDAIAVEPLYMRGVPGVLAQQKFEENVLSKLPGWTFSGGNTRQRDFMLMRGLETLSIQLKIVRSVKGEVWIDKKHQFTAEVQKSNGRKDSRKYLFNTFDIVAVCMWPYSRRWDHYAYAPAYQLTPQKRKPHLIKPHQKFPLSLNNDVWSDNLEMIIERVLFHGLVHQVNNGKIVDASAAFVTGLNQ